MLSAKVYTDNLVAVVVDEVHYLYMVKVWNSRFIGVITD